MSNGFVTVSRSITDLRWWNNNTARGLLLYMIMKANWKTGYTSDGTLVPVGSFATSIRRMAADSAVSETTIKTWLGRFEEDGIIERNSTHRMTIIKVLVYSTFSGIGKTPGDTVTAPVSNTVTDSVADHNRKKEIKEIKNNSPLYPPKGGRESSRKRRGGVRIDTPDWFKKQQSGEIPEEAPASPELIAEFEAMKKSFRKGE